MPLPVEMHGSRSSSPRSRVLHTLRVALWWGFATAACTGVVWGCGLAIFQFLGGDNFARAVAEEWQSEAVMALARRGVVIGFVIGTLAAFLLLRSDRGFTHRTISALLCGLAIGLATALGGALSVWAVRLPTNLAPPEVLSSLGFSVSGFLVGLGTALVRPTPDREDEEEDEEPGQPPGAGTAWVPEDSSRAVHLSTRTRSLLRLSPVGAVSLASLVASAVVAPSHAAIALLAVGLLGLALLPVLWSQERRLAAVERRFRGLSEPHA